MNRPTKEHYKIAAENGISRNTLDNRIKRNWDIERAITEKVNAKYRAKRTLFTKEQLEHARKLGINRQTLYSRVHKLGMSPEGALMAKIKRVGNAAKHDWKNEIYALYKGDELIADGTICEIAEATGKSRRALAEYATDAHKRKAGKNQLIMEYLGHEDDEDWDL